MTLQDWFTQWRDRAKPADLKHLACELANISPLDFATQPELELKTEKLDQAAQRLADGEPLGRILGHRDFWSLRLGLNAATLDPRPDSERVVEIALEALIDKPSATVLDLGTGSGCLLLSILWECPDAQGLGVDLSAKAIKQAAANATAHQLQTRARFLVSDWFQSIASDQRFDLIVANPPYIPSSHLPGLDQAVTHYDPPAALDGGPDGLDPYRLIAEGAGRYLNPKAQVIIEHGFDQRTALIQLFEQAGWACKGAFDDLAGLNRVLLFDLAQQTA